MELEGGIAQQMYTDSLKYTRDFINQAKKNSQIDYTQAAEHVENIADSVTRNRDALISISKLKSYDEYTFTHCINVSVIATAFGSFLGLPRQELIDIGMAAMFHDIGKVFIPDEILNKPARLTDDEFAVIKQHPLKSLNALYNAESLPKHVKDGIVQHHEKYNGKGYPFGHSGKEIARYASIIALSDVYDALTSDRVYKKGMPSSKALSIMFGMRGNDFSVAMTEQFIKCLGIFPVGSVVKLSSGEIAVVSESNPTMPLYPKVKVVRDKQGKPVVPTLQDLSVPLSKRTQIRIKIKDSLDPKQYNIDPAAVLF